MRKSVLTSLAMAALALQGCATMNQHECALSDWRAIGYEDGARGATADRIGKHRKACAKHGVAPDLTAYQEGRDDGLRAFCRPQRGFDLGASGGNYRGVCPYELEGEFVDAFRTGHQLHNLQASVRTTTNKIQYKQRELKKIGRTLIDKEAALISDATTTEQRVQLVAETRELAEQQGKLEAQIIELERNKVLRQRELDVYQNTLAYDYS